MVAAFEPFGASQSFHDEDGGEDGEGDEYA